MESQPQNPEFENNHENFHPCICRVKLVCTFDVGMQNSIYLESYYSMLQTPKKGFLTMILKCIHAGLRRSSNVFMQVFL